jgi:hypothetical protein
MRAHRASFVASLALAVPLLASFAPQGPTCSAAPHVEPVGSSSSGAFGAPALAGLGTPQVGLPGSFRFEISGGAPNAPGVLYLARHEQPIFSGFFSTTLWTGPSTVAVPFQCDGNGYALVTPSRTNAALPGLCGLDLIAQASVFDFTAPGGATWTNGLRFRFGTIPPPGG